MLSRNIYIREDCTNSETRLKCRCKKDGESELGGQAKKWKKNLDAGSQKMMGYGDRQGNEEDLNQADYVRRSTTERRYWKEDGSEASEYQDAAGAERTVVCADEAKGRQPRGMQRMAASS